MNFKKEFKYIHDTRPSVICLKNINSEVYWNDLSWYSKKRIINAYLLINGGMIINDLRNIKFKNIIYDFKIKKIINLEIISR